MISDKEQEADEWEMKVATLRVQTYRKLNITLPFPTSCIMEGGLHQILLSEQPFLIITHKYTLFLSFLFFISSASLLFHHCHQFTILFRPVTRKKPNPDKHAVIGVVVAIFLTAAAPSERSIKSRDKTATAGSARSHPSGGMASRLTRW